MSQATTSPQSTAHTQSKALNLRKIQTTILGSIHPEVTHALGRKFSSQIRESSSNARCLTCAEGDSFTGALTVRREIDSQHGIACIFQEPRPAEHLCAVSTHAMQQQDSS